MESFTGFDYAIFVLVLIISLIIGLFQLIKKYFNRWLRSTSKVDQDGKQGGTEIAEYLVASSSMGTMPIALSLLATFFSSTSLLGNPAEVYQYGIQYWISVFGMVITPLIGAFLTGPMFARLKVASVFEYFKLRFDSEMVRFIAVVCYLVKILVGTAIFIYGPATSLYLLAKISSTTAISIIGVVATSYTCVGGIRAVIWTDVFQMVIMFAGLFLVSIKGIYDIGGLQELFRISNEGGRLNFFVMDPNPMLRQSFWSLLIGMTVYFFPNYCIDQQMIQRFAASKNIRIAQIALVLNVPGVFLLITFCCLPGLIIYTVYANCDPLTVPNRPIEITNPNQILPYYVIDKFQTIKGSSGILLSAIFAGSLSSVSSSLNSAAAIIWGDFLKRFNYFKTFDDKKSTLTTKLLVLLCGAIATLLAFILSTLSGNLIQMNFTLNGSFNAPLTGAFILGSLFPFANAKGTVCGLISGFMIAIWLSFGAYIYTPNYPKLRFNNTCMNNTSAFNMSTPLFDENTPNVVGLATNLSGFNKFYSISYMWFTVIGTITTVLVGVIVSLMTGGNKRNVNNFLLVNKSKPKHEKTYAESNVELVHF